MGCTGAVGASVAAADGAGVMPAKPLMPVRDSEPANMTTSAVAAMASRAAPSHSSWRGDGRHLRQSWAGGVSAVGGSSGSAPHSVPLYRSAKEVSGGGSGAMRRRGRSSVGGSCSSTGGSSSSSEGGCSSKSAGSGGGGGGGKSGSGNGAAESEELVRLIRPRNVGQCVAARHHLLVRAELELPTGTMPVPGCRPGRQPSKRCIRRASEWGSIDAR